MVLIIANSKPAMTITLDPVGVIDAVAQQASGYP